MWRKALYAASGLFACAAIYGLSSGGTTQSNAADFDLRFMYPSKKADRLAVMPMRPVNNDDVVMPFTVHSQNTTIAAKGATLPDSERRREQLRLGQTGFVQMGEGGQPQVRIRVLPVNPVRTVPTEERKETAKNKLPIGCEPAFSPVTNPQMAHISSRCDA